MKTISIIPSYLNYLFDYITKSIFTRYFIVGITIITLTGCFKTLDFNLDFEGEQIVVRGTISPQDGAIIQVSHTLDPTGTYLFYNLDFNINNAVVLLYADDTLLRQIPYSGEDGLYRHKNLDLKMEVAYHLTVEADGFPPVKTEIVKIPRLPEVTFTLISENEEENEVRIDITVQDNSETTYYHSITNGIYDNKLVTIDGYLVGSIEQWEACGVIEGDFIGDDYIKDDCFKDKSFILPLRIETDFFRTPVGFIIDFITEPVEQVIVRFRSITQERYDFVATTDVPEDVDNAFREPVITFSNVIGGHGYFSAYQEVVYTHKL